MLKSYKLLLIILVIILFSFLSKYISYSYDSATNTTEQLQPVNDALNLFLSATNTENLTLPEKEIIIKLDKDYEQNNATSTEEDIYFIVDASGTIYFAATDTQIEENATAGCSLEQQKMIEQFTGGYNVDFILNTSSTACCGTFWWTCTVCKLCCQFCMNPKKKFTKEFAEEAGIKCYIGSETGSLVKQISCDKMPKRFHGCENWLPTCKCGPKSCKDSEQPKPTIDITSPSDGTVFKPGDTVVINVKTTDFKEGDKVICAPGQKSSLSSDTEPTYIWTIPYSQSAGEVTINCQGSTKDECKNPLSATDKVTVTIKEMKCWEALSRCIDDCIDSESACTVCVNGIQEGPCPNLKECIIEFVKAIPYCFFGEGQAPGTSIDCSYCEYLGQYGTSCFRACKGANAILNVPCVMERIPSCK